MQRLNEVNVNTPEIYDAMYAGYRRLEMRAYVPMQVLLPPLVRDHVVLDVGCGVGQYYTYLASAEAVDGIDFAPQAAEEARTHDYRMVYVQDFANGIALPDNSYTVVFCAEVLEHMTEPQILIRELRRLLQQDGIAIVTTPYRDAINIVEHVWAYDNDDMRALFAAFSQVAIFRYSVGAGDMYEHIMVIARK